MNMYYKSGKKNILPNLFETMPIVILLKIQLYNPQPLEKWLASTYLASTPFTLSDLRRASDITFVSRQQVNKWAK